MITKYVFRGDCTTTDNGDETVVKGPCISSGRSVTVVVKSADLARYKAGEFAQDCFPYLKAAQREFLISGISSEAWDEMFPVESDDDDGDD